MSIPNLPLNNGLSMPQLGLGTWKAAKGEVEASVATAIAIGYRHIDCAVIYMNEKEVGDAIKAKIEEGTVKREDLYVVSKLWSTKHHPDDVESACRQSLSDLGLTYLDLYLIHSPVPLKRGEALIPKDEQGNIMFEPNMSIEATWKAMENLVNKGLVRSIGLSNFNSRQVQRIVNVAKIKPVTNQVEVNPLVHQEPLFQFCRALDITLTAYTPIGTGLVRTKMATGEAVPKVLEEPRLIAMAEKYGRSVAQVILRWLVQRGIAVLAKSVREERLRENMNIFDFELDEDDMKAIFEIGVPNKRGRYDNGLTKGHPEFPYRSYSDDPNMF